MATVKIGQGYDVHAFVEGKGFVLGGVWIECETAIVAHSDGDVMLHALCDALLGALGRGDIGRWFPDSDGRNRDRDSREFLREVKRMIGDDGYLLGNADITIIVQSPRMSPHIDAMKSILAQDLECSPAAVNIKATTTEKLGFIGRGEGIAVEAVVLLESVR